MMLTSLQKRNALVSALLTLALALPVAAAPRAAGGDLLSGLWARLTAWVEAVLRPVGAEKTGPHWDPLGQPAANPADCQLGECLNEGPWADPMG
jgi:hypothetical protein